jgi:hydrogenase nickel incorporation protein HypA/HybF
MHELGVATAVLDIVRQHVPESQAHLVRRVRVRLGELAGVVPETLEFCFGAIVAGTPYQGAVLDLERVPVRGRCKDCGATLAMHEPVFWCPDCHSSRVRLLSGREMNVTEVELEDEQEGVQLTGIHHERHHH